MVLQCSYFVQSSPCKNVICLDGCTVSVELQKHGKPIWKSNNAIVLKNEQRTLIPNDTNKLYFYFENAQILEEWYYALRKGSNLISKYKARFEYKILI
jgi:hypothetical protein